MTAYISTRGKAPHLTFAGATLAGLASDGGLYVPEKWPKLAEKDFRAMAGEGYAEVAWRVMTPFIGDEIPSADLVKIIKAAYRVFDAKDVVPLKELAPGFYIMELFHGPTLAFKDVALQFLGHAFDYLLEKKKKRVTIVGATSGDTGSAAIAAFQGKANADIFILHPKGRTSEVQRRQMTTVQAANVHNVAIEGSFDDCQDIVKTLFADAKFRDEHHLSAVNSINWSRILAQIVYYVYAASRIVEKHGRPPVFCVPTGNFGNVYAAYAAGEMGAPQEKLLVATNRNDILHRFFQSGRMKADGVHPTLSPSMDIQVSSNFERLLFDVFGRQGDAVDKTMKHFRETGPFHLEPPAMDKLRARFASGHVDDKETLAIIKRVYDASKYILDPHSAVGAGVAADYKKAHPDSVVVSLATAHPAKFPDAVKAAIGHAPALPPHLADLFLRPEKYDVLPNDAEKVKALVRAKARK
jgi:threonine synthase